jgi:hypothetical protein
MTSSSVSRHRSDTRLNSKTSYCNARSGLEIRRRRAIGPRRSNYHCHHPVPSGGVVGLTHRPLLLGLERLAPLHRCLCWTRDTSGDLLRVLAPDRGCGNVDLLWLRQGRLPDVHVEHAILDLGLDLLVTDRCSSSVVRSGLGGGQPNDLAPPSAKPGRDGGVAPIVTAPIYTDTADTIRSSRSKAKPTLRSP